MKILGIIPARYASTRLPGKSLIEIGGKTMIQRVYEQVALCNSLTHYIVATDDSRIADQVRSFGGEVILTSPQHLNGTERCAEVLSIIGQHFDVVINIQGDEPFINPLQINTLADLMRNTNCDIGTLIKICADRTQLENPSIIKAVVNNQFKALYFSRAVIPYLRNENQNHIFYKHIGIYGYKTAVLRKIVQLPPSILEIAESLEQLRWIENGYSIHTAITPFESISIDTPADIERAITICNTLSSSV